MFVPVNYCYMYVLKPIEQGIAMNNSVEIASFCPDKISVCRFFPIPNVNVLYMNRSVCAIRKFPFQCSSMFVSLCFSAALQ